MQLFQNQFEPQVVMAERESRGGAEFRPIVALAFVAGVLIPGTIGLVEHGVSTWIAFGITFCVAGIALYRLRKERGLLRGRSTTIATVMHWEKAEGSDGGHFYSVQYRFLGPDKKEYIGKVTSQVELTPAGGKLPISYTYNDPTQNLPLATFWFFRFTYSGFAEWMN